MTPATRPTNAPPRGSTLIAVLVSFTLIAAAVTAMTVLFATEARRTRAAAVGAQLRQLLLAAPPAALDELQRNGTAARHVTVPTPVAGATLTLQVRSDAKDAAEILVIAKTRAGLATQLLRYAGSGHQRKLRSATLGTQP
jgi:Tfp pilus assembly protein PilV